MRMRNNSSGNAMYLARNIGLVLALCLVAVPAWAQGLTQAQTVLTTLESDLKIIIPVVATIGLMLTGLLYAIRMMHKDTFIHWFIGILIVGSAAEIVTLMLG